MPLKYRSAGAALALFALNAYVTLRLFHTAYTVEMGSIEAAFIGLARYIRYHFPHFAWFPLWYGGIPFPDAYPPLLHFIVAGVSAATGASPGLAYHIVTATAYSLGAVTLYWLALRLGAGRTGAFLGALGYSLLSPSCWLVRTLRADSGWFGPSRLTAMAKYGEGPHIASLVFLPVAILLLDRALERRKPYDYVLAALAMSATVLCNWIGAVALAFALVAYLLAGVSKQWKPAWAGAAGAGLYAYAVAMPWVTPSTIQTIRESAPKLVGFKSSGWPFLLFAASLPALAWLLKRFRVRPGLRFALLMIYAFAVMVLGAYWFHVDLLPQADRYHLELDWAAWLAIALVFRGWRMGNRKWGMARRFAPVLLCVAAVVPLAIHQRRIAREMEAPIDIQSTVEYKVSRWLGTHFPGRRVFAPGSISFWMDAFSDTPMLVGGFDNGIRNRVLWDVNFQILFGDKLPVALAWLKAFGCDAIVGDDFTSREVYHSYSHPDRLHSLPELWREGPDVIYAIPRRGGLAHAVYASDLVQLDPAPYETKAVAPYVAAIENPSMPQPSFRWRDPSHATITADLRPDMLLSVQIAWDKGWRATVNGEPRAVWGDKLGQVAIEPRCDGACTVDLSYTGGFELMFARLVSVLALAAGALWIALAGTIWRKRSDSTKTS